MSLSCGVQCQGLSAETGIASSRHSGIALKEESSLAETIREVNGYKTELSFVHIDLYTGRLYFFC